MALRLDPADWAERCRSIELIVLDVDGVLTDGRIIINDDGVESKNFCVRDGTGLYLWRKAGKRAAILSGRSARVVDRRAAELGIAPVVQGASEKRAALQEMLESLRLSPRQACFMGDDLPDLPALLAAGVAACPADAVEAVREACHFITAAPGGHGAVRELTEMLLRAQGIWDDVLASYNPGHRHNPLHPHLRV